MLLLALVLLGAAIALAVLCPRFLTVGRWQLFYPRVALTVWFGSFGMGSVIALAGIALGIVAVESLSHATPHTISVTVSGTIWVAAGIAGVTLIFAFSFSGSLQSLRPTLHSQEITYARDEHIGFTLVRYHSEIPEAYAAPGRKPEIFISSAMERLLSPLQLQAVLAHEFAHLRYRHGIVIRIAQLNAMLLPGMRVGRALERATRLRIELAADDAAARQVGAVHLANALTLIAAVTQDVGMALRAQRLARKRWPVTQRRRLPQGLSVAPKPH